MHFTRSYNLFVLAVIALLTLEQNAFLSFQNGVLR